MKKFERNQLGLMDKEMREFSARPKIGKVSEVYEHGGVDDDSNWEVDVEIDGGTAREQYVPVINPGTEQIDIPKAGDKVMVYYTEEENPKPHAAETVWTNRDRPPVGKAGMWRREYESGTSPAGDGNVYVTGYTSYDKEAANTSKYELTPEETFIQIAKHAEDVNVDPADKPSVPVKVEFYDSPVNDAAHVIVAINKDNGADSDATWGMKFDVKAGTWQIVDPEGFGIEASGDGNFTWHHKDITMNEVSGSTGPLDL